MVTPVNHEQSFIKINKVLIIKYLYIKHLYGVCQSFKSIVDSMAHRAYRFVENY